MPPVAIARDHSWRSNVQYCFTEEVAIDQAAGDGADLAPPRFNCNPGPQFPGRDHCPPGSGMIDFAALKPMVKPEHIKVFEFGPGVAVEDVKRGIEHLKGIWGSP